eukprot:XP_014026720.1 PREDICTED: replication factor C subunit 5 isoform X1 [Salmo salar]
MASTSKIALQSRNLPWVEKYRPQTLNDLISHKDILSTIQKIISEDRLPHLFYGPPGAGKTTTILGCAKQLYKDKEFNAMVLEEEFQVGDTGRGRCYDPGCPECIAARPCSPDAPGSVLSQDQVIPRLEYAIQQESIDITPDGIKAIVTLSSGDMRSSLNILQSTSMAYGKVTEGNVYTCAGHPLRSDIANILGWSLNKVFTSAYNHILYSLSQPNLTFILCFGWVCLSSWQILSAPVSSVWLLIIYNLLGKSLWKTASVKCELRLLICYTFLIMCFVLIGTGWPRDPTRRPS